MESPTTSDLHDLLRAARMPSDEAPEFDVEIDDQPFEVYARWLAHAVDGGAAAPHTITLATVGADGAPDARTVLLREVWMPEASGERGAVGFATSADSPKGRQLSINPHAAAVSYWREQHRQVRMQGIVERAEPDTSAADYKDRGNGFKAAARVGQQSDPLPDDMTEQLERAREELDSDAEEVPEDWTVYRLIPTVIEFWQGQPGQAQRRIRFIRVAGAWAGIALVP
ncbi:pyridoxine/pyridoxamine 5'-phosphate oxidase [Naasia lichenicola]|uniref:Pyridoxal 5'-phosphate synthase n=1 Tax=Naasia lichenicola TaxID=2565933 RepID=A0A4S4FMN2_9MICO|nr:pyridoxal 5'-phosphate synthase [Naasia lichenicola]THG31508.1 pyridoxal 5'-phosphate synthase [Naasia lichenicola]